MSYSPKIPDEMMHNLWILKRYVAAGPIARQLRTAIEDYLKRQVKELGHEISEIEETIEEHERMKREKREPSHRDFGHPSKDSL